MGGVTDDVRKVSIEIPLPPAGCNIHAKGPWRAKAAATKIYRGEVATLARRYASHFAGPVMLSHEWFMAPDIREKARGSVRRYRPLDEGNAIGALKAAVDGLVDAGLIKGDTHVLLKWGACTLNRDRKRHGGRTCVVLTIEPFEPFRGKS